MEDEGKIAAIGRSQAVIEFNLDGTIVTANDSFLRLLGYMLAEMVGKHHSLFVEPAALGGGDHRAFWASLNRGEFQSGEYKRIGKGGKEVWIVATYNPILDDTGKPLKVVNFASDVSEQKQKTVNLAGQIEAIGKSQAVIEFGMDGKVLTVKSELPQRARQFARRNPGQASQHVRDARRAGHRRLSRVLGQPQSWRVSDGGIPARRQGWQGCLDSGLLQSDP